MPLKFETRMIGPEEAEDILATTSFNRPVSSARVITLANEMRTGKWQLNGEPIIISETGKLLDGQHRLYAIMEAKKHVEMCIVRGASDNSFETIDTGRARSGGDIIAMQGYKHPKVSAAAASMIWRMYHATTINEVCPPIFQLRVLERYSAIQKWAAFVDGATSPLPQTSFLTALVYLDNIAQAPLLAERFCAGIMKGADLAQGSPILALRNRMMLLRAEHHVMNITTTWAATARVLTAFEKDEILHVFRKETSSGAIRRPAQWEAHMKELPKQRRLDDIYPHVQSNRAQEPRAAVQRNVTALRNIALSKEAVAANRE